MQTSEVVLQAGSTTEIADVALIVGGFVIASARYLTIARAPSCGREPKEKSMLARTIKAVSIASLLLALNAPSATMGQAMGAAEMAPISDDGVVKVKSAYPLAESITRLKKDVADKGIRFFLEVDQSKLAADAGITIRPSTLLIFGNPPLGTLFMKANPLAGLDWPVRLLVFEDEKGDVWAAYTDFGYIARRHHIKGMDNEAFQKASGVIASITSSVKAK